FGPRKPSTSPCLTSNSMPSTATIEPNRLLILSTLIMSGTLVVSAGGRPDPRGTRGLRGRPGGRKLPRLGGPRAEPLQGARESRSGRKTPDPGRGFSPDAAQTPGGGSAAQPARWIAR